MNIKFWIRSLGFIALLLSSACSSVPSVLENYQREEIERPYTLPKGVNRYSPSVSVIALDPKIAGYDSTTALASVDPLNFEISLQDNLSLLIDPLPLGLKYEAFDTEHQQLGFYGQYEIFSFSGGGRYQFKFNDFFAIRLEGDYQYSNIILVKTETASANLTFLFQLSETLAIGPKMTYSRLKFGSDLANAFVAAFSGSYVDSWYVVNETSELFQLNWSATRGFDLGFEAGPAQFYASSQTYRGATGTLWFRFY